MSKLVFRDKASTIAQLEKPEECAHNRIHEIGVDFDKDGMLLRLIRCQRCGLIMRQYLPTV